MLYCKFLQISAIDLFMIYRTRVRHANPLNLDFFIETDLFLDLVSLVQNYFFEIWMSRLRLCCPFFRIDLFRLYYHLFRIEFFEAWCPFFRIDLFRLYHHLFRIEFFETWCPLFRINWPGLLWDFGVFLPETCLNNAASDWIRLNLCLFELQLNQKAEQRCSNSIVPEHILWEKNLFLKTHIFLIIFNWGGSFNPVLSLPRPVKATSRPRVRQVLG